MAQSKPVPHRLTYTIKTVTGRVDVGPIEYPSKGAAERARREQRDLHGENWVFATIDPMISE